MAIVRGLIVALGFLTALPAPRVAALTPTVLARALWTFPLVGAVIGGLLLAIDLLLTPLVPSGVRAALLLIALVAITRGLHFDGLIDCCDGLFGGFTPERRLAIMRDSHIGAFGVLGALVVLLLRYGLFTTLVDSWRFSGLLLAPVLGRWAMVYAIVCHPYGRAEGIGKEFKAAAGRRELFVATISAVLLVLIWWPWGMALLPATLIMTSLVARFMLRRLPGLTGDCYGAIAEVVESGALLLILLLQGIEPSR